MHVIGDEERAIRRNRKSRGSKCSAPRFLHRTREAIRENDILAGRLAVLERLEDDVVTALRSRCAVP